MHPDVLSPHTRGPFSEACPVFKPSHDQQAPGTRPDPGEPLDPAQKEFVWLFPSCQEKPHAAARPDPHSRAAVQM